MLGILLAAGASRRFGPEDKLLTSYHGSPLISAAASSLLAAGCKNYAAVVSSEEVAKTLPKGIEPLFVPRDRPMAMSFHHAIHYAQKRHAQKLLICLADMPNIPAEHLRKLLAQTQTTATMCGQMRMPPIMLCSGDYMAALQGSEGDRGARRLLAMLNPSAFIALTEHEAIDIDYKTDISLPLMG